MAQDELLAEVVQTLDSLHVEFMLTGSHASSLQGEPRATHDIDFVVDLREEHVDGLLAAFTSERFYLSEPALRDALHRKGMFNLLDISTGEKVDFWLLTDLPFDQQRFQRRMLVTIYGTQVSVSSPEDTMLMKLRWASDSGGSERQLRDVQQVYELQSDRIDRAYVDEWAEKLGVTDLWEQVVSSAEPFDPLSDE